MIEYRRGDATLPVGDGKKIIVHVCNNIGRWGRGFVVALSKRWSEPEEAYKQWHAEKKDNDFMLGNIQLVPVEDDDLWVANMVGQIGIRKKYHQLPPVRYGAVESCLQKVADAACEMEASIHMPRIGCGYGGGKWHKIEPIIQKTLVERGLRVVVYDFDPHGHTAARLITA